MPLDPYQYRLPLRGAKPSLKDLQARQPIPPAPPTQPIQPIQPVGTVNPRQGALNFMGPKPFPPSTPGQGSFAPSYQYELPLEGGGPPQQAPKFPPAGQAPPAPPAQSPGGVNPRQGALDFTTPKMQPPNAYGNTALPPQQVQDLQAGIQQQKAAASQAAGDSNIASRFQKFNAGETGRAVAGGQSALMRRAGGLAVAAPIALGAYDTAQNVSKKLDEGAGFWDALGSTVLGNIQNSVRQSVTDTLGAKPEAFLTQTRAAGQQGLPAHQAVAQAVPAQPPTGSAGSAPEPAAPVAPPAPPSFGEQQQKLGYSSLGGDIYQKTAPVGTAELERRQYATPGGSAEGVVSRGARRGGFGGAATDAEAARNLQARAEQDAAASQIAAGFDRTTERLRDNRAEAMGISRAKLDASEGRGSPLTSLFASQGQQAVNDPFSLPGDGFGDAELRRSALERKMGDTRLPKAERQAAAGAYQGFLSPAHGAGSGGPANGHSPDLFNMVDKLRDNQRADQSLALQGQQFQETQRANRFNQGLQAQKEQRVTDKQYNDQGKAANEAILKDRTQYIKDHSDKETGYMPQMDQIANFGVWVVQNSPELQRKQPDLARRILDGTLRYEDWGTLDRMHKAFESSKPGWYNPFGSPASADEITQRYFDFNAPK